MFFCFIFNLVAQSLGKKKRKNQNIRKNGKGREYKFFTFF